MISKTKNTMTLIPYWYLQKKSVILIVDTHPNGIKKNDTGPTLIAIAQSNTKA
jgi:hypothetical protein